MTGSARLDFESCYTYNNIRPADGAITVKTVTVRVGGKGTTYISAADYDESGMITTSDARQMLLMLLG